MVVAPSTPCGVPMLEAATYLRKSVVKNDKDAESIDVQRVNNTKQAQSLGWTITREYVDEGISASKGLKRPAFNELIDNIENGNVKRVIVRDQARISRDELELLLFLKTINKHAVEVRDAYGVEIKNDLQTKVQNLVNADYVLQVSRNATQKKQENAAKGKRPGTGHRPYGYEKNYADIIPEEAKVIRGCAKRLLSGETLYGIVKDLNNRGILKYSGKTWKSQDLSKVLGRPENAALRSYKGEIVAKGDWPAILDEATYYKLAEKLEGNKAYSTTTVRKWLLSGILVCDLCGVKLSAKKPSYWCNPNRNGCGKIVRNMKALDDYMIRRVYEAIKLMPKVSDNKSDDTAEKIEALQQERDETVQAKKDGLISLKDMADLVNAIDVKMKDLRKTQNTREKLPVDDAESFLNATTDVKRATIARIYPVVGVKPVGRGKKFNPDQLAF